jgi:hypothetical protein
MSVIRKSCGKNIEFGMLVSVSPLRSNTTVVFLDAPILLQPADLPQSAASVQALDSIQAPPEEPELQPRAWWRANTDKSTYFGVPQTMEYLKNYLKDQKFNVSGLACQLI